MMAVTKLTIDGRKYVLLLESEYLRTKAESNGTTRSHGRKVATAQDAPVVKRLSRQDRGDVAESLRRLKNEKPIPYNQARKQLGL